MAQLGETQQVDALVEGRRGVQQPRQEDDVCRDDQRERRELGRDEPASVEPHARAVPAVFPVSQSTRPTQRSRFAAYQAIVRRTPSSQLTHGSHPVSLRSLS